MLDRRGHYVVSVACPSSVGGATEGEVVALAAAGGEEYLLRLGAHVIADRLTGFIEALAGFLRFNVEA